ncbi:MAG: helix-turn-helix domain-containing protein [Methylocella sp.]
MKNDQKESPPKFSTIAQIAECAEVSERTVRRWIKKGWLIVHRIDGVVRVSEPDLLAFWAVHRDH